MVIITDTVTIPVDFRFYNPDPVLSAWRQVNNKLKKQKIPAKERPKRPVPNPDYPTKKALVLDMIEQFSAYFPESNVKIITADVLYGTGNFMDKISQCCADTQIVTQLKRNQSVRCKNGRWTSLDNYFARHKGVETELIIRGQKCKTVTMLGH